MFFIHLPEVDSTQSYLINTIDSLSAYTKKALVTAAKQTAGYGRKKDPWIHGKDSLACSFLLEAGATLSLTSLEVAVLIVDFLNQRGHKLQLKWPNDILTHEGKKCGGLILHNLSQGVIVGLGLNLEPIEPHLGYGHINEEKKILPSKLALYLYQYLLENRLNDGLIVSKWCQLCAHRDQEVHFIEGEKTTKLIFKGIGDQGEAIMEDHEQNILKKFSGSLELIP